MSATALTPIPVTLARGDGIGPEIMDATLRVLEAAGAPLAFEEITVGESAYRAGHASGIPPEAWHVLRRNPVFLKAPITTPQGGGVKSLNVTIRKALGLYANVRPTLSYAPYVPGPHAGIDLVIVRENEEDLYAGIEHQQTPEVVQTLKLVSRPGCEKIIRYAFAYARMHGRRLVTCITKDNIMKQTDGLFHRVFDEVAAEYPEIEAEHMIVDIGAARLAAQPERFDVLVTLNLYGDILSDIASQVAGSVGLAGSANIGATVSMFEAIHGSAPDIAGTGVANPSGLLQAAVQMLAHVGQTEVAARIQNAWLRTLEDGIHTGDIFRDKLSARRVGTQSFATAVIDRLGERPRKLRPVEPGHAEVSLSAVAARPRPEKRLVGVDVFLDWDEPGRDPGVLGARLEAVAADLAGPLALRMITNRGVKVYPGGIPETFRTDHWRCRFTSAEAPGGPGSPAPVPTDLALADVLALLAALDAAGCDVIKTEHLYTFDGERGFSLGQGE
ncbi:MAG: NADP-dependent isocitrate dehydrogenase [Rubricoccaceae bacterium]